MIKIEGAFLRAVTRQKETCWKMIFATPMQPQVTAAAGKLGGDTAAAVQRTWGRGKYYCCPSRSCGSDNLGGTLREPFVFSFGGGGVALRLSMEKRNKELYFWVIVWGSERFHFIYIYNIYI